MTEWHVKNNQIPHVLFDGGGQLWLEIKECSLPEYIRLKARGCGQIINGKPYRLMMKGVGVFMGTTRRWYYADDPIKKIRLVQDVRLNQHNWTVVD